MQQHWTLPRIAAATVTVLATVALALALYQARESLILVFIGVLLAVAIKGPVEILIGWRVPRPLAIALMLLVVMTLVPLVALVLLPPLSSEVVEAASNAPRLYEQVATFLVQYELIPELSRETVILGLASWVNSNSERIIGSAVGLGSTVVSVFITLITILTVAVLWLIEEQPLRGWVVSLAPPANQASVDDIWGEIEDQLSGYLKGMFILCGAAGILAYIGFALMGLRSALPLAIITGLMNAVPIPGLGPALAAVIVGLASLAQSPTQALLAVVWAMVSIQIANNVLGPRILGGAVGVSPLAVIVAILVFGALLGWTGALLAIPFVGIIQIIVQQLLKGLQRRRSHLTWEALVDDVLPHLQTTREQLEQARSLLATEGGLTTAERQAALEHVDQALETLSAAQPAEGERLETGD